MLEGATVECSGHVVTKSIHSRARRFCPANHDAHDTCGPVHVVSSLKHSTWLDLTLPNWLPGEQIDGMSHWKRPSEWPPLACKKMLLEAIYGSFAEVTSRMYQVESVES